MSNFKRGALALAVAGLFTVHAHSNELQVQGTQGMPVAAFSQLDTNAIFEQQAGQPMQLATLSQQEMKETYGAWAQLNWITTTWSWGTRFNQWSWNQSQSVWGNLR